MINKLPQSANHRFRSTSTSSPLLLCAADDHYAMPLAVTLYSAAAHLRQSEQLHVFVLDGGISESNWAALRESLADVPVEMEVIRPDRQLVKDLRTSHHITHTAYLRLLAARALPNWVDKVIYLDSDLLVQDDLTKLWDMELENNYCLAVPDIACPHIDARVAKSNYRKSSPYLASLSPIRNWQSLGLAGEREYFNSGVMVLNISRWREERIEARLLACLRDNQRFVWCWDQYALNVVFSGQWKRLPLRWNQGAHAFEYPDPEHSPLDPVEFRQMLADPAIIHFTTEWKPWQHRPFHPLREKFYEWLDCTAWRGWRPEKPAFRLSDLWTNMAVGLSKQSTIAFRKLSATWAAK